MKYKILILLALIFLILAGYFFSRTNQLKEEINNLHNREYVNLDSLDYYRNKSRGDSLFFTGHYDSSFYYYQQADSYFPGSYLLERRKQAVEAIQAGKQDIHSLRKEIASIKSDFSQKADLLDEEIISKDSLIKYANHRIAYLSQHIKNLEKNLEDEKLKVRKSIKTLGKIDFEISEGTTVTYSGELLNGKASGYGYGLFSTGGFYEGEWRNNKRHGEGKYTWKDGNVYEGEYRNDKRHGRGTYFFNTGEKYVGEWENNKRSGEGTMFGPDGELVISGSWEDDELL